LNTKENTLDVKQYDEKYISHVESAENWSLFEITIKEKSELVHDVNNAVLKMQLRIRKKEKHSSHPTVKPTDLMQYLVRLVTPNGWTVLDPFNWSGSTWKAVMYENKDRNKNYKYIWIELTEEYLPIAKARIEYVINKGIEKEKSEPKQEEQTKQRKESALF
jgi:DNA modification methylase